MSSQLQYLGKSLNLVIFLRIWKEEIIQIDFELLTSLNLGHLTQMHRTP